MKILITGATGFVGSNLTEKLSIKGDQNIKCLVRKSSNVKKLKNLEVDLNYGDLSDIESLSNATKDVDIVYHCAALVTDWESRKNFNNINVAGTMNLLKACHNSNVQKFIYISSNDVVWNFDNHNDINEDHPYPKKYKHPYSESKANAEKLSLKYNNERKIETVVIRPCMVWGPGDTVILPRIVQLAIKGELFLIGNGKNIISLSYIDNLTDAIIASSLSNKAIGNVYFINDGSKIPFKQYLSLLLKNLDIVWEPSISIPYFIAYWMATLLEVWANLSKSKNPPLLTRYAVAALGCNINYSIEKAKNDFDYNPKVDLNEGLKRLKIWVESIGGVSYLNQIH